MALCHLTFALIGTDGEVKNLATGTYYECSRMAIEIYGVGSIAVDVSYIPVEVHDTYENGKFWRIIGGEKTEIERVPTVEQQTAINTSDISRHDSDIDDLFVMILEG